MKKLERGLTLITALAIVAIFLALALTILDMVTQNGQNIGNAYDKQQYYDVAEAGIDRGLADLDSTLPSPPSTALPGTPPATPSSDQTTLPGLPTSSPIPYYYSYWVNTGTAPTSTPDPLPNYLVPAHNVTVPAHGALIWSYSDSQNGRDVGIEEIATLFGSSDTGCALCAGSSVTVSGTVKSPPTQCQTGYKICTDPGQPTAVPIITGGSYTTSGSYCQNTCDYGGASTPSPITTNAPAATLAGFMLSQSVINQMADAQAWHTLSLSNTNVHYLDCTSGCGSNAFGASILPSAGQITFLNGSLSLSGNGSTALQYGGEYIVNGCMTLGGQAVLKGTTTSSIIYVLGSDAQCSGNAFSMSGNPSWLGGTLDTVEGSVSLSGSGTTGYIFQGNIIAGGSISLTGNGYFQYQKSNAAQTITFGRYSIASFAQY